MTTVQMSTTLLYRIVLGCTFLIIPVGVTAPHAMVVLLVIGGACGILSYWKQPLSVITSSEIEEKETWQSSMFQGRNLFLISFLTLMGYGAISSIWSVAPISSLLLCFKILILLILGLFWCYFLKQLTEDQKKRVVMALIFGIIFGLVFVCMDHFMNHPWLRWTGRTPAKAFAQGSLAISLAVWPCFYFLFGKDVLGKILMAFFALGTLFILTIIDCDTSFVVLILGGLVAIPFTINRQGGWSLLKVVIPLSVLAAPFVALTVFTESLIPKYNEYTCSLSYIERLHIWNYISKEIKKNPLLGLGIGSTSHLKENQEPFHWTYKDKGGISHEVTTKRIPTHPHNIALQFWLELGVIGVVIGIWFLWATMSMIQYAGLNRAAEIFCVGFFINALGIAWISLSIWQNWWIACLWLVGGILSTIVSPNRKVNS